MTTPTTCTTPPDGWACSRPAGHTGPCAATPLPGHVDRLRILAAAVALTHEAQAAGMVLTIETRPQEPLAMGNYFMALDVRSRRDSPQQVAAIGQELGPHPQSRLYGAINNLMAHIGAHGSVDSDHPLVDDTMQALKAVDGGTFQPGLATEAAAMAATVPAGWKLVPEESTPEMEEAGFNHVYAPTTTNDCAYVWSAMLKAAPQAPVAGQPAEPSPASRDAEDAERWRAFLACGRIRLIGTAGVNYSGIHDPNRLDAGGKPYGNHVHFGAEFWSTFRDQDWLAKNEPQERGRATLTEFADACRAALAAPKGDSNG